LLSVDSQLKIFTEILGSAELARRYISKIGVRFLARGHLAANGDFIYRAHQRATFWFINTAPQWHRFNNGNWRAIESASRSLAASRATTLDVYTGTIDVMSLEDVYYKAQNIFLDLKDSRIPAVNFFYKILIDESTSSGIVFIGINNVYLTLEQIKKSYIICTDVSDLVSYVRWRKNDINRGFSYACDVNQFLKYVPHIRGIRVSNLLL
jgi:DNA/RNA endonuclease G (NUC1)